MMKSVVSLIQNAGCEVEHIPGGCTGLCQPVDVGVNKPFKSRLKDQWEEWMIAEGNFRGTTSAPSRKDIADWTIKAYSTLSKTIIENAWKQHDYTWFAGKVSEKSTSKLYIDGLDFILFSIFCYY